MNILVEQWFQHYGAPKDLHSDIHVPIRSDIEWYKRVVDALNVHVTTGVPTLTLLTICARDRTVWQSRT